MHKTVPFKLNLALSALVAALTLAQLFALPLLIARDARWAWAIVALLPFHIVAWSLIHEAIHGMLSPEREANQRLGRFLSVLFGVSFEIVRFGHLMHHQHNRRWESEWYDPASQSRLPKAVEHYLTLFGGLYLIELGLSIGTLMPKQRIERILNRQAAENWKGLCAGGVHPAAQYFFRRGRLADTRADALAHLILLSASATLYGAYWPCLLGLYAGRALLVSFHDNVYHYGTPADNSVPASELALPKPIGRAMLNFNLHNTHHHHADVPWIHLPRWHRMANRAYDGRFLPSLLRQLKGPIAHPAAAESRPEMALAA